ncbi:amino acid adenylation domain-containing protein [Salinarimonas sp.]|uniref:non-ribosomal peptide synthetase n=1 Tax=Salinarimonas sp. TaxID=2766526 RepID=UPI0032D97366
MAPLADLLDHLAAAGLRLCLEGDDLKLEGSRERLTPELVGAVRARKPDLVAHLRALAEAPVHPLSAMQAAYLVGREEGMPLGGVSAHVYHEFDGVWDVARLRDAVRAVVDRHDALRMRVCADGARFLPPGGVEPDFDVLDLAQAGAQEREEALATLRDRLSHRVAPLASATLLTVRLSLLGPDRMRLHLSHDGLAVDGLSMFLLVRDLCDAYDDPAAFASAPSSCFADCLEALAREVPDADDLAFWREAAATLPPGPALPTRKDPNGLSGARSARRLVRLSPRDWSRLQAAARDRGLSAPVALASAFCETLSCWCGGEDFSLNVTLADRPPTVPEVEAVVGVFTRPLPAPFRHEPATVEARAAALRGGLAAALDHRSVSGLEIMRGFGRPGGAPLPLPVTFNCAIGAPGADGRALARLGRRIYAVSQTPQVWLNAFVLETDQGLEIELDVVEALFAKGFADAFADSFGAFLRKLAYGGGWSEARPDLLPPEQRARRAAVNATEDAIPDGMVQDAFLRLAAERPDAVAIVAPEETISYGALAARASAIAAWLTERGLQRDELVAVVMTKGWEQVAAALGVLMAGGAYLPVAADLPRDRIHALLALGEARLALAQPVLPAHAEEALAGTARLGVDASLCGDPIAFAYNRRERRAQDDLAYVLFTSGSTGVPKGVMISHCSVLNLVHDINQRFQAGPTDRLFGISAFNFDLSVYDIFGALSCGAALVLPRADEILEPQAWAERARAAGVTIWNSVPQIVRLLLDAGLPPSLRLVMMSGDKIPVPLTVDLARARPDLAVYGLGGPTETTVWNIVHPIENSDPQATLVPYGVPTTNNLYYVLDRYLRECPDDVTGELHAAGTGLARGYWRDPERTQRAFFTHAPTGERLYATGDLGRYRADGVIEILGRSDFQVKINGNRVELEEIEACLGGHPDVREAAAVAARGPSGDVLVAYVSPASGAALDAEALRAHVAARLPGYMVPERFVALPAIPLSANGKVDRQALASRALAPEAATGREAVRGPADDRERVVAGIFADVLGAPVEDVEARFGELGGTSLAAVRVILEIARRTGVRIAMRDFLRLGSIRAIGAHLNETAPVSTAAE